jgi:putative endonuclease
VKGIACFALPFSINHRKKNDAGIPAFFYAEREKMSEPYVVYILECSDGTLYTGITNRLQQRMKSHQQGKGAKYTRGRLPVRLRYVERGGDKSWALKREREIKKMSRRKKWELIKKRGVMDGDSKEFHE